MEPTTNTTRYKLVQYGGGVEELDRFALRDRIRTGDITAETQIAVVGSDDWRVASAYPELVRYFEMAATRPMTRPGVPLTIAPPRDVRPMSERIINGLAYPLAGGEAIMLIALAILSAIPLIGILGTLASTVIMVAIIRSSADGKLKMPLVDTSQAWELIRTYFRVLAVTLIALAPVLLFTFYGIGRLFTGGIHWTILLAGIAIGYAFAAVYYPACLATIAVWDNVVASLNPAYVFRVIRTIGIDYFIVIAMWFVVTLGTTVMEIFSPLSFIPIVGGLMSSFVSLWALFYVSHLLGYAVYRHAPELGWD